MIFFQMHLAQFTIFKFTFWHLTIIFPMSQQRSYRKQYHFIMVPANVAFTAVSSAAAIYYSYSRRINYFKDNKAIKE